MRALPDLPDLSALLPLSALEHAAFVVGGLLVYVLVTRVGQQRRHPSAAMGWVLAIAAFPYLGLPLFLLLGTRKLVRPSRAPRAATAWPDADCDAPPWALRLLAGLGQAPPLQQADVRFHADGEQALADLLALIAQARHSLDLCTYVLGNDAVGDAVGQALTQAAQRGVHVRLLIDSIGSLHTHGQRLRALRQGGVQVRRFMPLLHNPRRGRTNLRNHRKLAAADGCLLWSGGRNLAAEYFNGLPGQAPWLDLSFSLQGPLAALAQQQFQRDWQTAGGAPGAPVATPVAVPVAAQTPAP